MEVKFSPTSEDNGEILYKLQRKLKVFNTAKKLQNRGYNLVACSSKYALIFVASPQGTLSVYNLKDVVDKNNEANHLLLPVYLYEKPSHIAVSCDHELLAVTGGQLLQIYSVTQFQNQNVNPTAIIKCDVDPATYVTDIQWNPCVPDTIALAYFDGSLIISQVTNNQIKKVQAKARCLCWSPKGKQVVVGNNDGSFTQYKPDLTPAKTVPAPNLFEGAPVEVLAIYWISTYQFSVVYKNAASNSRPVVSIVNTPKAGQPSCINYEDICYSMGSNMPYYYYLQGLPQWNMILASSSNSMEIATLGSVDGTNWIQWCQFDEVRPELPLTDNKQESYPIGICIDNCAIHQLPWGENETLPHMPLLHIVTQTGLMVTFNIVNLNKQAPQLCSPPQNLALPASGMTNVIPDDSTSEPTSVAPASVTAAVATVPTPAPVPLNIQTAQSQLSSAIQSQPAVPAPQTASTTVAAFGSMGTITHGDPLPGGQNNLNMVQASLPQAQEKQLDVKPNKQQLTHQEPPSVVQTLKPQSQPELTEADLEKINKEKIKKMKGLLIKEVNDFQTELYRFRVKMTELHIKRQKELESLDPVNNLQNLDGEKIKKDCSMEDLHSSIVQLKLELVRACAVIAEARTHVNAKDYCQWTQADPLTTKRVATAKKLAYYVQNQLEQAHKLLDYKWNEIINRELQSNKPGQRMIRPLLDEIYQPLVKQQEILSRQQAVLRTLKNTLKECDTTPMFKSTSLLRNTPFKNKDPLSKLTKNILNMSIEPQNNQKHTLFTAQKLDALRDMLANHKTVKIKPTSIDLSQQLETLRQKQEKHLKDKIRIELQKVKLEPAMKQEMNEPLILNQKEFQPKHAAFYPVIKEEKAQNLVHHPTPTIPSFGGSNLTPKLDVRGNVARTLFTEETQSEVLAPKSETQTQIRQQSQIKAQNPTSDLGFIRPTIAPVDTRSVLKQMLQNKTNFNVEQKNDTNTFMGHTICSPSSVKSSNPVPLSTVAQEQLNRPTLFASKPSAVSDNDVNVQKQSISEPSKLSNLVITKSEKGLENTPAKPIEQKLETKPELKQQETKPLTNLFGFKTATPPNSQNVPDVLKTITNEVENDVQKVIMRSTSNNSIKKDVLSPVKPTHQNVLESTNTADTSACVPVKTEDVSSAERPIATSTTLGETLNSRNEQKQDVIPTSSSLSTTKSGSIFISPSITKSQSIFGALPTTSASDPNISVIDTKSLSTSSSPLTSVSNNTSSSASSLFATAVASDASSVFGSKLKTQESIFSSNTKPMNSPTPTVSVFGSTSTILSSDVKTSTSSTPAPATPPSIFSSVPETVNTESTTQSPVSPQSVFGSMSLSTKLTDTITSPTSAGDAKAAITTTQPAAVFETQSTTPSSSPTTTSTQSVFAQPTTQSSIFGSPSNTQSVFGTPPKNQGSIFGTSSTQSIFGSSSPTTSASVFGLPNQTTQASIFGNTTPSTQPSVFGTPPNTTQSSIFGTPINTTQTSIFGAPTNTTQSSIFGTQTNTTQTSIFGTQTNTTQSSIFGTQTNTTQSSIFGTQTSTAQPSIFGTPTSSTQASIFGTPATQSSIFGTATTTASSGSIFGSAEANLFASASISTTSAPTPGSTGSIFGGSPTGSAFGTASGGNVFGKSTFGQSNSSTASVFGGGATFGQKPAQNFWGTGNTNNTSAFGSSPTGFGQQATTQASVFGGESRGSFSSPSSPAQAFTAPQQGGFGGSPQQNAPAFGGSSAFGSKPVFGQSTGSFGSSPGGGFGSFGGFNKAQTGGFGAPASFGGGATFGNTSPSKVFGSSSPGFPGATQSNATFESLATQNTLSFGNLAQQSPPQVQAVPTFNTSPSFTGWRG